ncbi:MAG: histidine phosphatase family protein [Phycisphaerales bacterium]|nr:histidine phosphatase family protein [Phycisphaerales bacterium]
MTKLILVKAAQTEWQIQGRLVGDTDLQLNEGGHRQALTDARAVAQFSPQAIFCGADGPTKQTAAIIAEELSLKIKTDAALREINLGHWEGLTEGDFKERFSKVYKQWRNDPLSVEPPEGESVSEVAGRLKKSLEKILKRNDGQTILLVLGRLAYAAARCELDDRGYGQFWQYVEDEMQWHKIELEMLKNDALASAEKSKSN